jgi:hypothetical protein
MDEAAHIQPGYCHTQRGHLHLVVLAAAAAALAGAWSCRDKPAAAVILVAVAAVLVLAAFMFRTLTVRDEGEHLAIRYGPLPVFRKRIPYAEMTAVERGRSALIDGWGIPRIPGRGWTYNLWGFDCAKLRLGERVVRIGSDEADALVDFLRARIAS